MKNRFDAIMPIAPRPEVVFVSGDGSWITDEGGRRYLDFVQGWAVNALGHSHPAIVAALRQQASQLINPSPAFYNRPMVELANRLVANSAFEQVFFANNGAEANEGAVKLAVFHPFHAQGDARSRIFWLKCIGPFEIGPCKAQQVLSGLSFRGWARSVEVCPGHQGSG